MPDSQHANAESFVDRLTPEGVRKHLTTDVVGHHMYLFGTVDSTNRVLARLADCGASEGTVVMAEEQTAGRGRHGSAWFSPAAANLHASVLFHPRIAPRQLPLFAPIASLALAEAVWLEGVPARIKWPTDVVVRGRKVGGVLVEAPVIGDRLAYVILGIVVNLNIGPAELAAGLGSVADGAVSLHELLGRDVDLNVFAATLLNRLEKWHRTFSTQGLGQVLSAWRARNALHGCRVEIRMGGDVCEGRSRAIAEDGSLIVEDDGGQTRRIVAGAVRLLDHGAEEHG